MAQPMKVEMRLSGVDGVLATLHSLPAEVVSKRGGPVKSALRKGAVVILKAEQANLRSIMGHQVNGERRESTGFLLKNLIVTRGRAPKTGKGERYIVRVKRKIYPDRSKAASTTTTLNAARLEYGTSDQDAEPFVRPAVQTKGREAISVIEAELLRGLDRIVSRLAAQNKGR